MRGPPMPANSMPARRAFSAAIRWAASRSPEASPATMPTRRCLAIGLADDAALRAGEEFEKLAHLRAGRHLRFQLGASLLQTESAAIQRAVGTLQPGDLFGRKAAALEPFAIDAVRLRHVAGRGDIVRQILRQVRSHAGEGVSADMDELVHERRRTEDRPVAYGYVPGELTGVREYGVVANLAIVREVHVGHDPIVVADAC